MKPLSLADALPIQRIFPRWETVKYLAGNVPWPFPPDGAVQFISGKALPQMERGEGWFWTLRLVETPDKIIGCINLKSGEAENRGYWLAPEQRGKGLMSEACEWTNDFWFESLGKGRLRVHKAMANSGSRRISERQGMRMVQREQRDYVSGRLESEVWEITAEEWREWKKAHASNLERR